MQAGRLRSAWLRFARMPPTVHGRLAWAVVFAVVVAYQGYEIFIVPRGVTRVAMGARAVVAGEIAGASAASQTFETSVAGFNGITFHAAASGAAGDTPVALALYDVAGPDDERFVAGAEFPAAEVAGGRGFTWTFPPIDDPTGRRYRLEIRAPRAEAGHGLGVWATRQPAYPDGRFDVGDAEQWGDLVFATHGRRETLFANRDAVLQHAPGPLRSSIVAGLAFALCNTVLAWFLYGALRP
jgi:hypothetical protein